MTVLLTAFGLVLIIEGLPYFINPAGMQNMARLMAEVNPKSLRIGGFFLMLTGLALVYVFNGG